MKICVNYLQKRLFTLLFSCLFVFELTGQLVNLEVSDLNDKPKSSRVTNIIGSDEEGFIIERDVYTGNSTNGHLEKQNYSFDILKQLEYESQIKGESLEYSTSFYFHNKLYINSTIYDKKAKESRYYYQEADPSSFKTNGVPVEYTSLFKNLNESYKPYNYELSENGQMIAFFGRPGYITKFGTLNNIPKPIETNDGATKGSVVVLGQNMEKKWELNYAFPNNGESYKFESVKLDDLGNFFILGILYDKGAKNSGGKNGANYHYVITAITNNGKDTKEYHISLGEKFISTCAINFTSDGNINCTGFYSYKEDDLIKGSFLVTIDPKTQVIVANNNADLPLKFLKLLIPENKAESDGELADYTLSDIIRRENNGVTLILEKSYENSTTVKNATTGLVSTQTVYHYNEIVLITLNADNSVNWYAVIPKKQASVEYDLLSYALHVKDEMIYLLYNDNEKNLNEDNPEKLNTYIGKNAITTLVTISANGDWLKKTLFTEDEKKVVFLPEFFKQINQNESLIYMEKDEKYMIGKVTF